jgi:hypothetical protein
MIQYEQRRFGRQIYRVVEEGEAPRSGIFDKGNYVEVDSQKVQELEEKAEGEARERIAEAKAKIKAYRGENED